MTPRWLLRMSRWARHPPSMNRVVLAGIVLALCLALAGVEHLWGWPDWLRVNGRGRWR